MGGEPYKSGWALFWVLPQLNTKERPCHVYSNLMPSNQTIGQTTTCNRTAAASKLSPDGTQHWMAPCHGTLGHGEHGVPRSAHCNQLQLSTCRCLQWSITQSFLPWVCIALEAVFQSQTPHEARSRVGAHSSNFDRVQENGPKVGGEHSFTRLCYLIDETQQAIYTHAYIHYDCYAMHIAMISPVAWHPTCSEVPPCHIILAMSDATFRGETA